MPDLSYLAAVRESYDTVASDYFEQVKPPAELDPLSRGMLNVFAEVVRTAGLGPVARTYSGGWAFPARQYNGVRWAFYGGYIRAVSLDWFEERLRQIAQIPASYQDDEYDERPRGLFLVSHDVDGMSEWRVHNGGLVIGLPDGDYHYFDA